MLVVTVYLKTSDESHQQVKNWLMAMQNEIPHKLVEINIAFDPKLSQKLGDGSPAVQVGPYILRWPFTQEELHVSLLAANDRKKRLEQSNDKEFENRIQRGHTLTKTDRFSNWFSRNYMLVIAFFLFSYIGLPFMAPVFMHYGFTTPAKVIYAVYKPFCHQLAFRSFFLYGEQPFYPRELAHIEGYKTYEMITNQEEIDILEARKFIGNEQFGYKVAFCQRDIALYGSLGLSALIFNLSGRKIKGIPWYIWVIVGILPIAIDGVSQIPSLAEGTFLSWFPARESVPSLRLLTGFLFGMTTGWYLYPMLEESMTDVSQMMDRKISIVNQLNERDK